MNELSPVHKVTLNLREADFPIVIKDGGGIRSVQFNSWGPLYLGICRFEDARWLKKSASRWVLRSTLWFLELPPYF